LEVVDAELFALVGSEVLDDDTVAEFVMAVPGAVPAVTFRTIVNVAVVSAPTEEFVQF
jgi:hypothetical protein